MIKMVIFDLDGTLLNTLDDLADAGNHALSVQGFPVHETEKYKYFIGNGIPKLIERILPCDSSKECRKTTLELFSSYYDVHMNDKTKPYNGAHEVLDRLKDSGIVSVVVTNKSDEFASVIVRNHFGELIVKTYGSKEGYPKKPDPYWVNVALADFGFNTDDVLYVGDSGVDMKTAKNAGIVSCGVTWGFRTESELLENGADYICNEFGDILTITYDLRN